MWVALKTVSSISPLPVDRSNVLSVAPLVAHLANRVKCLREATVRRENGVDGVLLLPSFTYRLIRYSWSSRQTAMHS